MSDPICYTVTATISDSATLREYVDWLRNGHVQQVIEGGAESGVVVLLDPDGTGRTVQRVVTQYIFASRDAFERYEREHAPALRADGLARFGPQTGRDVVFARTVGVVLASNPPEAPHPKAR